MSAQPHVPATVPDPQDEDERRRALDPTRSFLVQAPAGAGKTELLVQRYLRLLAVADEPEHVLAITFTRKAAAEMRRRVGAALEADPAAAPAEPSSASQRRLHEFAAAVRRRSAERHWNLDAYPARLRISTIDGLNAGIAGTAPLTAGGHALRTRSENSDALYKEAARLTVRMLSDDAAGNAIAALLTHLDNRLERLEEVLAQMLARRDQWLPIVGGGTPPADARTRLEGGLERVVSHEFDRLTARFPEAHLRRFWEIVRTAATNLDCLPPGTPENGSSVADRLEWWRCACERLLTQKGQFRRSPNVRDGFPPDQRALKAAAIALIHDLSAIPGTDELIHRLAKLPDPHYSDIQWQALDALLRVLPIAAAQLKLVFAARGQTDYTEVAVEAQAALGDDDEPSELAFRVDWRIRHILLDEFQDTSDTQYKLLQALTRGWSAGDGRTLFLVGDPMQSIYRFRQAEVRLFFKARDECFTGVELEFIRLRANFRSDPPLVRWVNETFATVFPERDDALAGSVAFAPSKSEVKRPHSDQPVSMHAFAWNDREAEAQCVAGLVTQALGNEPGHRIGILIRSRNHAPSILAALDQAGIAYSAAGLGQVGQTALADDLLTLTRALVHPGDRLAWLSVLRAPWCGLTLADIERVARHGSEGGLPEIAANPAVTCELSPDGRQRLERVSAAFELATRRFGKIPLRDVVEGLWLELGGPVTAGADLEVADLILRQWDLNEQGGDCGDVLSLSDAVGASSDTQLAAQAQVEVMSIHKAKGLEFDTVILPGLGYQTRSDSKPALLWQRIPVGDRNQQWLLAPIAAADGERDRLYDMLWDFRCQEADAECDRLAYVAATRAKRRLYLLGQIRVGQTGPSDADHLDVNGGEQPAASPKPARGSLLERLWPALSGSWPATPAAQTTTPGSTSDWFQPALWRLPADWRRPPPPAALRIAGRDPAADRAELAYDWAGRWTMHAGTVAHRWLQQIATVGVESFDAATLDQAVPRFRRLLQALGVEASQLERACSRVHAILRSALDDDAGRWVLSSTHEDALNEWPITVFDDGRFMRLVVDRTFVDRNGTRWVIDYKTGSHEGGDREAFLGNESDRYREQLAGYRAAFRLIDSRPVRTALYYPLLRVLHEVEDTTGTVVG